MILLDEDEGKNALCLAKQTLVESIAKKGVECPKLSAIFNEKRGIFVTLTKSGELRGCIGYIHPVLTNS